MKDRLLSEVQLLLGKCMGRFKHLHELVDFVEVIRGKLGLVIPDHFVRDCFHAIDALPLFLQFGVDYALASLLRDSVALLAVSIGIPLLLEHVEEIAESLVE